METSSTVQTQSTPMVTNPMHGSTLSTGKKTSEKTQRKTKPNPTKTKPIRSSERIALADTSLRFAVAALRAFQALPRHGFKLIHAVSQQRISLPICISSSLLHTGSASSPRSSSAYQRKLEAADLRINARQRDLTAPPDCGATNQTHVISQTEFTRPQSPTRLLSSFPHSRSALWCTSETSVLIDAFFVAHSLQLNP